MSITSAIVVSGDLIIEKGQTSAGLLIEGLGYVIVENGARLEDSIATSQGMITVDAGGILQRTDVEAILLHALVDGLAVILSKSAGMVTVELIIMALAIAVAALGWLVARRAFPKAAAAAE